MTRKDFELIAAAVKKERDLHARQHRTVALSVFHTNAVEGVAYALAHSLATTNPLFDRSRFLRACGVPE